MVSDSVCSDLLQFVLSNLLLNLKSSNVKLFPFHKQISRGESGMVNCLCLLTESQGDVFLQHLMKTEQWSFSVSHLHEIITTCLDHLLINAKTFL